MTIRARGPFKNNEKLIDKPSVIKHIDIGLFYNIFGIFSGILGTILYNFIQLEKDMIGVCKNNFLLTNLELYDVLYFKGTLGRSINCWTYVPDWYQQDPNNVVFIFGLIAGLLLQFLITHDLFFTYLKCCKFFINEQGKVAISKFAQEWIEILSLKLITAKTFRKYFWRVSLTIFFLELSYCLICYYAFSYTFLNLSLKIWTVSFIFSVYQITFPRRFLNKNEGLKKQILNFKERIKQLDKDIVELRKIWTMEFKEQFKEEYLESMVIEKIAEYRARQILVLREMVFSSTSETLEDFLYYLEAFDDDDSLLVDFARIDWVCFPSRINYVYIFLYLYYLIVCCKDSLYLYERVWLMVFGYPNTGEYVFKTLYITNDISNFNTLVEYSHCFHF